jgi:hypothetical protein
MTNIMLLHFQILTPKVYIFVRKLTSNYWRRNHALINNHVAVLNIFSMR